MKEFEELTEFKNEVSDLGSVPVAVRQASVRVKIRDAR